MKRKAEPAMRQARQLSRQSGETEHVYGEAQYAARSWPRQRRVIIKAEVVRADGKPPKDNPRFVITNLKQSPQWIYEQVYCQRGEIENRIKELHDLQIDRTSCSDFWANQFRVLLTAAAYVLMQELRLRAAGTACARAQILRRFWRDLARAVFAASAAKNNKNSPLYGMPILEVDRAKSIVVLKRGMRRRCGQRTLLQPEMHDAMRGRQGQPQ